MRALLVILLALPLGAQEAAKTAEQAKPAEKKEAAAEQAKPEEKTEAAAAAPQDQAAASPVPAAEANFSGSIDFGNRWVNFTGGSFDTYRTIVDLGEGPKLFGADVTITDPGKRLFDRLDVRANNWGGDPYNTMSVGARKSGVYDFTGTYRNVAYFNALPSFADPTRELGLFLNQRSYDIHRRISDIQLDLRPGHRVVPFLAYGRNSNFGRGVTTFVANSNEYPVTNQVRDSLDNYRGGVRLEMRRWHVTLEQGGTVLKDDQRVFTSDRNTGNRGTPLLGQQLLLTNLQQAYGVRGHSIYSRALATANPFTWLNLYGNFLFSQPENDVRYSQNNAGQFATLNPLLFFAAQQDLFSGVAKMPHTSGSAGAELRILPRLRIIESWMTDRLHNASFGVLTEQLFLSGAVQTPLPLVLGNNRLVMNYNQQQVDALFDITPKITLRGGHRYVWGDSIAPPSSLTPAGENGELRRHVGLAGLSFRTGGKLSANFDFEGASAQRSYFRTSLHDYQLMRVRGRYQAFTTLAFAANFSYLNNEKPDPGINYKFLSRQNTISAIWTPGGGQRASVIAEYTRSTLRSDISYLVPQMLTTERNFYRDNAHTANALVDFSLPSYGGGLKPKASFGGALFYSGGSRPTRYYQPVGRLALPLHKNVAVVTEWRWHGYSEPFYRYEDFRAHLFTTGLRISR